MKSVIFCLFCVLVFATCCQAETVSQSKTKATVKGYVCAVTANYAEQTDSSDPLLLKSFDLSLSKDSATWQWSCKRVGGSVAASAYDCTGTKTQNSQSETLSTTYTSTGGSNLRRCMHFVDKIQ